MNDAQLKAKLKQGKIGKFRADNGLYFRISKEQTAFWVVRYTLNGKRREISIGRYGKPPEGMSLAQAKLKAAEVRVSVRDGIDPIAEKKRLDNSELKVINDIAEDWLKQCDKRLEYPAIPRRVYYNEIAPFIGELACDKVNPRDILTIVRKINDSGRPSIANDALVYCKQILNHAMKLGMCDYNVALAFNNKDAGGVEKSRTRALTFKEVEVVFKIFENNVQQFSRENYIACVLLLCLGVRKGELIAATWEEFDLNENIWHLPAQRTKTKSDIKIPIPAALIPFLHELQVRSCGSEYVFPARRKSKRRAYISDDTLNHALAKLFGNNGYKKKENLPNYMANAGIEHFVVHDLRRTCRSLLAELKVPSHTAERCLNHKIRGVEGIYDRYDYFDERKEALEKLTCKITKLL